MDKKSDKMQTKTKAKKKAVKKVAKKPKGSVPDIPVVPPEPSVAKAISKDMTEGFNAAVKDGTIELPVEFDNFPIGDGNLVEMHPQKPIKESTREARVECQCCNKLIKVSRVKTCVHCGFSGCDVCCPVKREKQYEGADKVTDKCPSCGTKFQEN